MEGGEGFGVVFHRADLRCRIHGSIKFSELRRKNKSSPLTIAVAAHLACMLVYEVEHSFLLGIPVDALAQSLPPQLACDYLQQVHLDWLLNEHHVVLRHGWNQEKVFTGLCSWQHVLKTDISDEG